MDKQSEHIEKLTQKWVKEAGVEQPSPGFVGNVMQTIEQRAKAPKIALPLVSKRGWLGVALFILGCVAVWFLIPGGEAKYVQELPFEELPQLNNPFEGLKISKTTVYAIGFLALFLIQIPFLKRRFIN